MLWRIWLLSESPLFGGFMIGFLRHRHININIYLFFLITMQYYLYHNSAFQNCNSFNLINKSICWKKIFIYHCAFIMSGYPIWPQQEGPVPLFLSPLDVHKNDGTRRGTSGRGSGMIRGKLNTKIPPWKTWYFLIDIINRQTKYGVNNYSKMRTLRNCMRTPLCSGHTHTNLASSIISSLVLEEMSAWWGYQYYRLRGPWVECSHTR